MIIKSSKILQSMVLLAPTVLMAVAPVTTPTATAADSDTLAGALASMQSNLGNLSSQAGELQGQIGEVGAEITTLQTESNALVPVISQKQQLLKDSIKESYMSGNPSSLEVIASNDTFSGVVGQQHYQDEISGKTKSAAESLAATKKQLDDKVAQAQQKQNGLLSLKGQLDEKAATAEAQVGAQQALLDATKGQEAEYQKLAAQSRQAEVAAIVSSPSPSAAPGRAAASPSPSPNAGQVNSVRGNNPYPYGQCTWYVYNSTGRGQMGNAGTWRATSSTPAVGKIMIWRAGEQGAAGAGHVGVVIGVNGNSVTIRHMNWNGWGVVSTGTFQSTGKFY